MNTYSISFVLLVLVLSLFIGAALGSVVHQVFGLNWFDIGLIPDTWVVLEDFYVLRRLEIQITPGSILGVLVAAWYLYRQAGKM